MNVIKGIEVANNMAPEIIEKVDKLKKAGIKPLLQIVRIGDDGSDIAYERGILNRFSKLGIDVHVKVFDKKIKQFEFEEEFTKINNNQKIHGILLFRPLPSHLDEKRIAKIIDPIKDIDALSETNLYKLFAGDETGHSPCTPEGAIEILDYIDYDLSGKNVVVIGRSLVVGKPLAMLALKRNATVTICHSRTKNIEKISKNADVLLVGVGRAKMVNREYVKKDAIVIDIGINVDENGKLCGDVDFDDVKDIAAKITPVPGGAGSVTTSVLAKHLIKSCEILERNA